MCYWSRRSNRTLTERKLGPGLSGRMPITIPLGAYFWGKNGYETQRRSTYGLRPREGRFRGSLGSGLPISQEGMLLTSPVVPPGLFFTQRFTGRNPATVSSDRVCLSGSVHIAAANEVTTKSPEAPLVLTSFTSAFGP